MYSYVRQWLPVEAVRNHATAVKTSGIVKTQCTMLREAAGRIVEGQRHGGSNRSMQVSTSQMLVLKSITILNALGQNVN